MPDTGVAISGIEVVTPGIGVTFEADIFAPAGDMAASDAVTIFIGGIPASMTDGVGGGGRMSLVAL